MIIIVIGILLLGYPINTFSLSIYTIIFQLPFIDYATSIFVVVLLVNTLIAVGLIMLGVALSREKHEEIQEEEILPTIMIDCSYVKDIASELASALSYYFSTPVKLKLYTIVIDILPSLHDEIRKFIEKFLEKNQIHNYRVIWDGKQFIILRLISIERLGLYQCIHCSALFTSSAHENYHRWAHYPR